MMKARYNPPPSVALKDISRHMGMPIIVDRILKANHTDEFYNVRDSAISLILQSTNNSDAIEAQRACMKLLFMFYGAFETDSTTCIYENKDGQIIPVETWVIRTFARLTPSVASKVMNVMKHYIWLPKWKEILCETWKRVPNDPLQQWCELYIKTNQSFELILACENNKDDKQIILSQSHQHEITKYGKYEKNMAINIYNTSPSQEMNLASCIHIKESIPIIYQPKFFSVPVLNQFKDPITGAANTFYLQAQCDSNTGKIALKKSDSQMTMMEIAEQINRVSKKDYIFVITSGYWKTHLTQFKDLTQQSPHKETNFVFLEQDYTDDLENEVNVNTASLTAAIRIASRKCTLTSPASILNAIDIPNKHFKIIKDGIEVVIGKYRDSLKCLNCQPENKNKIKAVRYKGLQKQCTNWTGWSVKQFRCQQEKCKIFVNYEFNISDNALVVNNKRKIDTDSANKNTNSSKTQRIQ